MAKMGFLYLRKGVWEGEQLLPTAWIDKVCHATENMHEPREPELQYSNLFWALPNKHVYMAVRYHGQVIMVLPDLDIVMVKTGRGWCRLDKLADLVSSSVKSGTSLPADTANARLMANKILDVSTEKSAEVGPTRE
jgi:hypothetical protein